MELDFPKFGQAVSHLITPPNKFLCIHTFQPVASPVIYPAIHA
jgi:hypothetical protein